MTYDELSDLLERAGYYKLPQAPGCGEMWSRNDGLATACVERTPAHQVGQRPRDGFPRPEVMRVRFDLGPDGGPRCFHWASAGSEGFEALRKFLREGESR